MNAIDWIWLPHAIDLDEEEFDFAWSEVQRGLRGVGVLFGSTWPQARGRQQLAAGHRVLCLRHARLSLERHCVSRLLAQIEAGITWAEACDSVHFQPMRAPDYATLRGMERYVATHIVAPAPADLGQPPALVALTTAGFLDRMGDNDPWVNSQRHRVQGAYAHDASGYFAGDRQDLLPLVPSGASRFLDVGGGEGAFLAALRSTRPAAHLTLVEQSPRAASVARARGLIDRVEACPFDEIGLRERYDCISFLDVLEHMEHPGDALRRARELLAPSGVVLASLPNVGHWSVIADLLEGRWDEAPAGIHCVTHLRFFTLASLDALFDRAGLQIEFVARNAVPCPAEWVSRWSQSQGLGVDAQSLDTYAYLVRAVARH